MSGGITLSLDEPSQEQKAAAARMRALLFNSNTSISEVSRKLITEYDQNRFELRGSILKKSEEDGTMRVTAPPYLELNERDKERIQQRLEEINTDITHMMMTSPMFTNVDGFTAMNDTSDVCVGAECTMSALESMTGQTNAGESFLDDFFPQPLQPFSF
jgi:hypothetical protein